MSKPAAVSSERTSANPAREVVTTKLYMPRPAPGFVARPRLVDQLERGRDRTMTLVCAPAGFGKTSVLADWGTRSDRAVAWLSLDAGDDDPVRFWRHVTAAIGLARPGFGTAVTALLGSPPLASFDDVVTAIVNELAAEPAALSLVLDDYHVIETTMVHESLAYLLDHAPADFHVVVAGRADPPLPLARLRGQGRLTEVRAADLRFTADEAALLLREAVASRLDDDVVSTLATRTEGWAAGLQLAALSLRNQPDVAAFVATFSGSHRYVIDYLTEEVLDQQPEDVRQFLLHTSVLDRLSGPLCDAVTGRTDSQVMLEAIERANLFLVPLDDVRGWWRNHQLFTDLLRVRLRQLHPDRLPELHRNAARWYDEHGLVDDALHHATAAGDFPFAARLIERDADALLLRGEERTAQRWLASLPRELVASRPRLMLVETRFVLLPEVEALFDAAERAYADSADEPYEPSVGRGVSRFANIPAMIAVGRAFVAFLRGDADATTSFATRALGEVGDGEWMLDTLARAHLGGAEWLRGRTAAAEQIIGSGVGHWVDRGAQEILAMWSPYLGQIQRAQGRLDAALATYRATLDDPARGHQPGVPAAGGYVGMAEVAYQRNQLDAASEYVTEALALCRRFVTPDAQANGLATLAWIRHAQGDSAGARDAMDEAAAVADASVTDLLDPVPAQRARLQLAQGNVSAARAWIDGRGLRADDEPDYAHEPAYLVLARVLLAEGKSGDALALLHRLGANAAAQSRLGSVIEIGALRALGLSADDDDAGAYHAIVDALLVAQTEGHVRVFVDEGAPMAELLRVVVAEQRTEHRSADGLSVDYLGRLVRAFDGDATRTSSAALSSPVVADLVTQLSERELEVLRLLAGGKQNREIADELFLALNTVKKHVTHIFEKLGATNRTEAADRARALGLLP